MVPVPAFTCFSFFVHIHQFPRPLWRLQSFPNPLSSFAKTATVPQAPGIHFSEKRSAQRFSLVQVRFRLYVARFAVLGKSFRATAV